MTFEKLKFMRKEEGQYCFGFAPKETIIRTQIA
jgi:hypothetical protein